MTTHGNPGRVAGLWYLLLVFFGPLRLIYIPNKLFVHDNAAATVANIAAHEWLFRIAMVADLFGAVVLVLMGMAFYRLFKRQDEHLAMLVVILGGMIPASIYFVGVACDGATLMTVRAPEFLATLDPSQRNMLAVLFLKFRDQLNIAAEMLWGVWLLPLALLVYRSRFLPKFLGVWLAAGGVAYVVLSVVGELWPQYQSRVFNWSQPAYLGEVALMLWLVIKGARPEAGHEAVAASLGER